MTLIDGKAIAQAVRNEIRADVAEWVADWTAAEGFTRFIFDQYGVPYSSILNAEMRAGVQRETALRNLADRTGMPDIRGLVGLLVQSMRFGTSVADALRVYSDEFRDRRMQAAEEQAAK